MFYAPPSPLGPIRSESVSSHARRAEALIDAADRAREALLDTAAADSPAARLLTGDALDLDGTRMSARIVGIQVVLLVTRPASGVAPGADVAKALLRANARLGSDLDVAWGIREADDAIVLRACADIGVFGSAVVMDRWLDVVRAGFEGCLRAVAIDAGTFAASEALAGLVSALQPYAQMRSRLPSAGLADVELLAARSGVDGALSVTGACALDLPGGGTFSVACRTTHGRSVLHMAAAIDPALAGDEAMMVDALRMTVDSADAYPPCAIGLADDGPSVFWRVDPLLSPAESMAVFLGSR